MTYTKNLIEVSLPIDIINDASAYDKMPGIGAHPKGIHQWWARLPLPTARAILFASLVDDPSSNPEQFPTDKTGSNCQPCRIDNFPRFGFIQITNCGNGICIDSNIS
jgi:adenine-specific DNA methylase